MKVKDFLNTLDETILGKIDKLSQELRERRSFSKYNDFEDIVYGLSMESIKFYIKPVIKQIPSYFTLGSKI